MPDSVNAHNSNRISNLVDHAIVAHANTPVVFRSSEFAATTRTRIVCECSDTIDHFIVNAR